MSVSLRKAPWLKGTMLQRRLETSPDVCKQQKPGDLPGRGSLDQLLGKNMLQPVELPAGCQCAPGSQRW